MEFNHILRRFNRGDDNERANLVEYLLADVDDENEDPFAGDDDDADYIPERDVEDSDYGDEELPNENCAEIEAQPELEPDDDEMYDEESFDALLTETSEPVEETLEGVIADGHDPNLNDVFFLARTGRRWYKEPVVKANTRVQVANLFRTNRPIGPNPTVRTSSLSDIFHHIFNSRIQKEIIERTNQKANEVFARMNEGKERQRIWKPLTLNELDAYFGILLYIGAFRDGHRRLRTLWDKVTGHTLLRAAMSFTRFEMINTFLRFDDSITRRGQAAAERYILQPVQILIDEVNKNLASLYTPGANVTIDEQLKAFRGRCRFRQYMPSKPAKYGLKFWWITDSETSYPLRFAIYTGSSDGTAGLGRGYDVVMHLMGPYLNCGRNLTVDNFFTSVDLALNLLEKKTTLLGTMRKNKRDIPKAFVVKEELDENGQIVKRNNRKVYRPLHSSIFGFSEKMALVSYVPKPNKAVLILSTQHNCEKSTSGPLNKPDMILDYNRTKGGVDVFDQMTSVYSCSRKTNRWPMVVFYNLLDVAALASVIIYRHFNPPTTNKKLFRNDRLIELSEQLMETELNERSHTGMHRFIGKNAVDALRILGRIPPVQLVDERLPRKQVRCSICPRKDDHKTKTVCDSCNKPICGRHQRICCVLCLPNLPPPTND